MDEKWVIDECPDAHGHWTIRYSDGTENGDTERQPIATVYDLQLARHIVYAHNAAVQKVLGPWGFE